jgi:hypothetical protein
VVSPPQAAPVLKLGRAPHRTYHAGRGAVYWYVIRRAQINHADGPRQRIDHRVTHLDSTLYEKFLQNNLDCVTNILPCAGPTARAATSGIASLKQAGFAHCAGFLAQSLQHHSTEVLFILDRVVYPPSPLCQGHEASDPLGSFCSTRISLSGHSCFGVVCHKIPEEKAPGAQKPPQASEHRVTGGAGYHSRARNPPTKRVRDP